MKKKILHNPLMGTDGQLMVMAAHRYCLGRQTYIVGSCVDWLRLWWDEFEHNTRNVIIRDTIEALQDDLAGSLMDKQNWEDFAKWAWERVRPEDHKWCMQAVAHRNKPWPLK